MNIFNINIKKSIGKRLGFNSTKSPRIHSSHNFGREKRTQQKRKKEKEGKKRTTVKTGCAEKKEKKNGVYKIDTNEEETRATVPRGHCCLVDGSRLNWTNSPSVEKERRKEKRRRRRRKQERKKKKKRQKSQVRRRAKTVKLWATYPLGQ